MKHIDVNKAKKAAESIELIWKKFDENKELTSNLREDVEALEYVISDVVNKCYLDGELYEEPLESFKRIARLYDFWEREEEFSGDWFDKAISDIDDVVTDLWSLNEEDNSDYYFDYNKERKEQEYLEEHGL